jgi:hypothetical protein
MPAGILTVVVEEVAEFKADCTSDVLQLDAVTVCACAQEITRNKRSGISHLNVMVGETNSLISMVVHCSKTIEGKRQSLRTKVF